jgi:gas vesicle protein
MITGVTVGAKAQIVIADPAGMSQRATQQYANMIESIQRKLQLVKGVAETKAIFDQGKAWYDALKQVSTTIQNYKKIYETLETVNQIASVYSNSFSRMKTDKNFSPTELAEIGSGYTKLIKESSSIIDDLMMAAKPSNMNLTDKERFDIINAVYDKARKHKGLVEYYSNQYIQLSYVRAKKTNETRDVLKLYGLSNN